MSGTTKFKIHTSWLGIYFFFAAAALLMPVGLSNIIPSAVGLYRMLQMGFFLSALLIVLWVREKLGIITWLIIIYYLFSFYMSRVYLGNDVSSSETIIVISLSIICSFGYQNYRKTFLNSFTRYFEIIAVVQIILQILYPNGMYENEGYYQNWILGFKNIPIRLLLPGACLEILLFIENNGSKQLPQIFSRPVIYLVAFSYIVFTSESATSIVGLFVFLGLLYYSFVLHRNFPKAINFISIAIISMICFLLVYFARIQYYFDYLITVLLDKNMDFTGRTRIWDMAFKLVKQNLFIGVGMQSSLRTILRGATHAHQYWLNILLTTGVAGFVIHIFIYAITSYQARDFLKTSSVKVFMVTIIAFMIMGIDEALVYGYMILPLLAMASEYGKQDKLVRLKIKTMDILAG